MSVRGCRYFIEARTDDVPDDWIDQTRKKRCEACGRAYGVMVGIGDVQCPWCAGRGLPENQLDKPGQK